VGLLEELDRIKAFDISLLTILWVAIITAVAIILERVLARYIRRLAKRAHVESNVTNGTVLAFRLLILIGALASLTKLGGVPTEWFVTFSALGGAAVGFASTQTIGNFIAGLYLLASRPFRVGDLVRIGTVEGVVQEITINYTKVLTIGNNIVSFTNLNILQKDITNFLYQDDKHGSLYCYTFEIGFDHNVSTDKIAEILNEVFERHKHTLPQKPSYMLLRSAAFERVYMVYLYVEHPQDVFGLRPQIAEEVFKRWDAERAKSKQ
jgi:small-conductance mechanosensitive channel